MILVLQKRPVGVAQYSDPFFDIGGAGYYANWFGNAFERFLTYLFEGQTWALLMKVTLILMRPQYIAASILSTQQWICG